MAQTTHEKKLRCMQRNAQQQISADCTSPSIAAALLIASNLQQRVAARAASAVCTGLPHHTQSGTAGITNVPAELSARALQYRCQERRDRT
jgi:hypothetical protein